METKIDVFNAIHYEADRCFTDIATAWYTLADLLKKSTTENFDDQRPLLESYNDIGINCVKRLEWIVKLNLHPFTPGFVNEYFKTFYTDYDAVPGGINNIPNSTIVSVAIGFEKYLRGDASREYFDNAPVNYTIGSVINERIRNILKKHNITLNNADAKDSVINLLNDTGMVRTFTKRIPSMLADDVGPIDIDAAIENFANSAFMMENPNDRSICMQYALFMRELKIYRMIYNKKDKTENASITSNRLNMHYSSPLDPNIKIPTYDKTSYPQPDTKFQPPLDGETS